MWSRRPAAPTTVRSQRPSRPPRRPHHRHSDLEEFFPARADDTAKVEHRSRRPAPNPRESLDTLRTGQSLQLCRKRLSSIVDSCVEQDFHHAHRGRTRIPSVTLVTVAGVLVVHVDGTRVSRRWSGASFGQNPGMREWLHEQDIAYVMATRNDDEVPAGLHTDRPVKDMIGVIRAGAWKRRSCGDGARGPRVYDWARTPIRTGFPHDRRGWVVPTTTEHLAARSWRTASPRWRAAWRCRANRVTLLPPT